MTAREQLARFAACLWEPGDVIELRLLPSLAGEIPFSAWVVAGNLYGRDLYLANANGLGFDCYAGVNPRRTRGGRKAGDVALARVLVADFDRASPSEAARRLDAAGLPLATLALWSGHGCHAYYRLAEPIADLAAWGALQRRLAAAVGSDAIIHDAPRIMRLPGLVNHKPPVRRAELLWAEPTLRYSRVALDTRLPRPAVASAIPVRPVTPRGYARADRYFAAALAAECREVSQSRQPGRNERLNRAAYRLGQLLLTGAGATAADVEDSLTEAAAVASGNGDHPLTPAEVRHAIRSGLKAGMGRPRVRLAQTG